MRKKAFSQIQEEPIASFGLMRLPQALAVYPVGKSTWWAGVKEGRFPQPVKLGPRTTAWRVGDIRELIERLSSEGAA